VLALFEHTVLARSQPELALGTLQQALAGGAVVLKGKRGEAGETVRLLLERLEAERLQAGAHRVCEHIEINHVSLM
jgi:hypothetical protein